MILFRPPGTILPLPGFRPRPTKGKRRTDVLVTERRDHILVISMRREAKRNAIDAEMSAALAAAFDELEDDPDLWVGVLTGTPSVFSAGNDLAAGSGEPSPRGGTYGLITRSRTKPLICAVEGYALGGGFEMVLACDVVVASETARFGLPEVSRGVIALYGGLFRSLRRLPSNVAREMVLTGEPLTGERGVLVGLVNHLTPPGGALDRALELGEKICANAPAAVQHSLRVLNAMDGLDDEAGWAATQNARDAVWSSADMREGISAFRERRQPRWSGK